MFPLLTIWKSAGGAWTPLSLGSKLLNWWDGTIVDEDPATEVNSWEDQKGSFDWQNVGPTKKPEYDSANNLIIFDVTNQERLSNDANVASFNRSDGEYWFVIDWISSVGMWLISLTSTSTNGEYFILTVDITNKLSILTGSGGSPTTATSTTTLNAGKNIIRIKSTGSGYVVNLNNIDISSEFAAGNGEWESIPTADSVSIAALIRPSVVYTPNRAHAILRCDDTLSGEDVTNMYNYLNAKY